MAIRDVVPYPDSRLKRVCDPVETPSDLVDALAADLLDTMRSHPGCVGIAAPQLGECVRMVAFDLTGHKRAASCHGETVLCNPQIESAAGAVTMREGCLSIPDFTGNVARAESVVVVGCNVDGTPVRLHCDAFECRVLLHELDHLDGVLFLDRVASAHEIFPRKRYR